MKILLLGATGSIGTSTINCVRRNPDQLSLAAISVNRNVEGLAALAAEFKITRVAVGDTAAAAVARSLLPATTEVLEGQDGLLSLVNNEDYDVLLNALVGAAGFRSTVAALKRGKRVALANKESLVIGGDLITSLLAGGSGRLLPVDSEHSAILQCVNGEDHREIESITVTASGGPFRTWEQSRFAAITPADALRHPTWSMGAKITIDSATLMNKGFEVIEAHYLFNLAYERIHVLVHPQSIIHSMVTFQDGAVMAQLGLPDMELPIQYALSFPSRLPIGGRRLDLAELGALTFERPDLLRFPCLRLCIEAGSQGGTLMAVLNAANEIAVAEFLAGHIGFSDIPRIIETCLSRHSNTPADSIEAVMHADATTRENALILAGH